MDDIMHIYHYIHINFLDTLYLIIGCTTNGWMMSTPSGIHELSDKNFNALSEI